MYEVSALSPDIVIHTGDLCLEHGDKQVYTWMIEELDKTNVSYFCIPGNHDDSSMMCQCFGYELTEEGEVYFHKMIGGHKCLFLDSSKGSMSSTQLNWVRGQISQNEGAILVFMHHPPLEVGVAYMDQNYAMKGGDGLIGVLAESGCKSYLFCGHYHVERTIFTEGTTVFVTPSTFMQLDDLSVDFAIKHYRPGFRIIDIGPQYDVRTQVIYSKAERF